MSVTDRNNLGFDYESPAYRFGSLETQANNCLCVPMVYGKARAAGNKIWQSPGSDTFSALVAFAEGTITGFSDVRINDILTTDSALSGCSYTAYLGNGTQEIDSRVTGTAQTDKAALVGGLKYTAYLALTIKSGTKVANNYMDVSAVLQGKAVRVYTDTVNYTTVYTNNPIWCILDFLTCYNGCGLSFSDIDIQSFIDAASYCDEKINPVNATGTVSVTSASTTVTGSGTKFLKEVKVGDQVTINGESKNVTAVSNDTSLTVDSNFSNSASSQTMVIKDTRYTLNIILDTRKTRQDWLNEMLICCRGFLKYNGSKASIVIEQDIASVQSFTQDDIIKDSEVFWTTPKEQRCDIFKVRYMDTDNQYARAYAVAEADAFLNDPPIIQEIVALGVTSFKQASRLAWFYLNQANTCNKFISFSTTRKGMDRTAGDIIDLTSTFIGYQNKKLVVVSMTETQQGQIQLICREFNSSLYNDTLGSVAPIFNIVNINDVLGTPDDVQNLSSAQNLNTIILTWQPVSNPIVTYEIREGNSWNESSVVANNLTGSSYTLLNIQKGTYKYWIKSVNKYGNYSVNAALSIMVITDILEVNTILNENILDNDLSSGTFIDCNATYGRVALNPIDNWINSGTWDNTGKNYAPDGYWGANCEAAGSYTTKVYDIGTDLTSIMSVNYNLSSRDSASNIVIEWKYSEDNVTWTDWQVFAQGSYKFRYYQFKITLNNPNNSYTALSSFIVNIDVPDRDFYFMDQIITTAANGVTVTFNPAYIITPAVVANISDGTNGYCVVTAKNTSQATIKAYNNSGTAITAQVDIRVKGY